MMKKPMMPMMASATTAMAMPIPIEAPDDRLFNPFPPDELLLPLLPVDCAAAPFKSLDSHRISIMGALTMNDIKYVEVVVTV